jgi:phage shock protein C
MGIGLVILLMMSFVWVDFQWWDSELSYSEALALVLPNGQGSWITWGLIFVLASPALSLMYTGVRWIFGIGGRNRWFHGMTTVFFVLGVVSLLYAGWGLSEEFDTPATLSHKEVFSQLNSDTLYLSVNEDPHFLGRSNDEDGNEFLELYTETAESRIYGGGVEFRIEQTDRIQFYYEIEYEARGSRLADAGKYAKEIKWYTQLVGNQWSVDPFIATPKSSPYRGQKIRVVLYVPLNKTVCVSSHWSWISWQNEFKDRCLTHNENGWQK